MDCDCAAQSSFCMHIAHLVFLSGRCGSSTAHAGSGAKKHGVDATLLPRRPRNVRCQPDVTCVDVGSMVCAPRRFPTRGCSQTIQESTSEHRLKQRCAGSGKPSQDAAALRSRGVCRRRCQNVRHTAAHPRPPSLPQVPTQRNTDLDSVFEALHVIPFDFKFLLPKLFFFLQFLVVRVYQCHAVQSKTQSL